MRKLKNLEEKFFNVLENEFPNDELQMMFDQLAEKHLEISNTSDVAEDLVVNDLQEEKFEGALARLKNNEPIQYILGESRFFGRAFKVNSNVHVPRPETETMVNWVIEDFPAMKKNTNGDLKLLDIGTGCGLLPITLNKELLVKATAADISEKALELARENAILNDAEVQFLHGDVLKWERLPETFDIIVSNPPYVLEKSKKDVQRKILDHEPAIALYVKDEDPMIFNRKIAQLAREDLAPNGFVYVEINKYLGAETARVFEDHGFKTEIRKDIFGSNRTLKAFR